MPNRNDDDERLRQQRDAAEQAFGAKDSGRQRLFLVGGIAVAVAVVAAAGIAIVSGGGSDEGAARGADEEAGDVTLPARTVTGLTAAAADAGCVVRTSPSQGRGHTTDAVTYRTNPPTSGPHNPDWAQDGIYDRGGTPPKENLVHSLEHGRVQIQYAPSLPAADRATLEAVFDEQLGSLGPGYHLQLFENTTAMPYAVAATAWTQLLGCRTFDTKTIDALRAFRERYTDKGPEFVP